MSSHRDQVGAAPAYIELLCHAQPGGDYTLEAAICFESQASGPSTFSLETTAAVSALGNDGVSIWIDRWRNRAMMIDATLWVNDDVFACMSDTED